MRSFSVRLIHYTWVDVNPLNSNGNIRQNPVKNFILQSMAEKKIGQTQGTITRRRLVLNPRIKQVVINLHTKYEHSSMDVEKSLMKNFILQSMEGKKIGQI